MISTIPRHADTDFSLPGGLLETSLVARTESGPVGLLATRPRAETGVA